MNTEQIGALIRAILSAVGGYFVGKGIIDASTMTAIVGALATVGVAILVSAALFARLRDVDVGQGPSLQWAAPRECKRHTGAFRRDSEAAGRST